MVASRLRLSRLGNTLVARTTRSAVIGPTGVETLTRPPVRFMDTPAGVRSFAPRLGEHTRALLRETGMTDDAIDALMAAGAAAEAPPLAVPTGEDR